MKRWLSLIIVNVLNDSKLAVVNWKGINSDISNLYDVYINVNQNVIVCDESTGVLNYLGTTKLKMDYVGMKKTRKYKRSTYLVQQKL